MIAEVEDDRQIKCWQKVGNIELKKKAVLLKFLVVGFFFSFQKGAKSYNLTSLQYL